MGIPKWQECPQNMALSDYPGTPRLLRHPPVYAFHQRRQLRAGQVDLALMGYGPDKSTPLKALGKQTGPLAILPDHLDLIAPPPTEQKQMP